MKILVLMPLQEQSAYMAMGIYKALPAEVKDKCFCMPAFMDYLVVSKICPNWEYALFDTLFASQKILEVPDEDVIIIGNVKKDYQFDAIFNFQDLNEDMKYNDPFLDTMREKVASEELLANMVNDMYRAEDSRMTLHNCQATADFLAAYLGTDPHLDDLKKEYEEKLKALKESYGN